MAKESKVWDAETDKKVKALAELLNAQMVSLNGALRQFEQDCAKEGYSISIDEAGMVQVKWIEPEIVTPGKNTMGIV